MADVLSDAVKLAVHEQTFGWQTAPNVSAQIGTLGLWTPDVTDPTLTAIAGFGWTAVGDTPAVTGRGVGLSTPDVVWSCTDILFDTTGLGGDPFDGLVVFDVDTDMFIAFFDLASSVIPGDSTLIAANASGIARF